LSVAKGFAATPPTVLSSVEEKFEVDPSAYTDAVYPVNATNPTRMATYDATVLVTIPHEGETHVKTAWVIIGSLLIVICIVLAIVCFLKCRKENELGSAKDRNASILEAYADNIPGSTPERGSVTNLD